MFIKRTIITASHPVFSYEHVGYIITLEIYRNIYNKTHIKVAKYIMTPHKTYRNIRFSKTVKTVVLHRRLGGGHNREIDFGFGSCRACRACGRAGEAKLPGSASAVMFPPKVGVGGRKCGLAWRVACGGAAAARPVPDRCPGARCRDVPP